MAQREKVDGDQFKSLALLPVLTLGEMLGWGITIEALLVRQRGVEVRVSRAVGTD